MRQNGPAQGSYEAGAESEAVALLGQMMGAPVSQLPPAQARYLEQRTAGCIERMAAEYQRTRKRVSRARRLVTWGAAAAMAAGVLLALWVSRTRQSPWETAQITRIRGTVELATQTDGRELRTGEDALARATLTTGSTLEVGPSTRVRFKPVEPLRDQYEDTIALEQGNLEVEVPPLRPGVTLSVRTPGAVVTVHGTRFAVEHRAEPSDRAETRVSVKQGQVSVRSGNSEQMLVAGQTWSSRTSFSTAAPVVETAPANSENSEHTELAPPPPTAPLSPRSTLAAENELLQAAMAARKNGHPERAVRDLDRLLARYPGSPLTETARVERLRALAATGQSRRMATEARRYLADYPHGFARQEVSAILADTPESP